MSRVTSKELDATFVAFVKAATDCGIDTDNWLLTHGSKTYGNTYGVYRLILPGHGHGDVYRFSHIGMTASEADRYLRAATAALWLVLDARR